MTLRAVERRDLERLNQFNNDVEIEVLGGGDPPIPQSLARLETHFDAGLGDKERDGTNFAIEVDGTCIGGCALFNFDEVARVCEIGITIGDRAFWGQGYGGEAIELLVGYGFRHFNLHKICLTVHGENERAIRAYRRAGFVEEGRLREHVWSDGAYRDLVHMGLLRAEA